MDLSKLPKLSKTDEPPPREDPPLPGAPEGIPLTSFQYKESLPGLAEGWISIALGVILLFMFPNTISYVRSPAAFEQANPVTDAQGNSMRYVQTAFFWTDLGMTIFSGVLIVEGVLLAFLRKSGPIYIAFGLTVAAALFNLLVTIHVYSLIGFPIYCALAVAVAGYMALTQWRLIEILRRRGR